MMASESNPNESIAYSSSKFYQELEAVLKRHQPIEYIPFAVSRLKEAVDDRKKGDFAKWIQTPHHKIFHSIEANCAFARKHNRDPVNLNRLFRVMNVYH